MRLTVTGYAAKAATGIEAGYLGNLTAVQHREPKAAVRPLVPPASPNVARFEVSDFAFVTDYAARRDIPFSTALWDLVRIAGDKVLAAEVEPAA